MGKGFSSGLAWAGGVTTAVLIGLGVVLTLFLGCAGVVGWSFYAAHQKEKAAAQLQAEAQAKEHTRRIEEEQAGAERARLQRDAEAARRLVEAERQKHEAEQQRRQLEADRQKTREQARAEAEKQQRQLDAERQKRLEQAQAEAEKQRRQLEAERQKRLEQAQAEQRRLAAEEARRREEAANKLASEQLAADQARAQADKAKVELEKQRDAERREKERQAEAERREKERLAEEKRKAEEAERLAMEEELRKPLAISFDELYRAGDALAGRTVIFTGEGNLKVFDSGGTLSCNRRGTVLVKVNLTKADPKMAGYVKAKVQAAVNKTVSGVLYLNDGTILGYE
jgi:hypothetical protein